MFSAWEATQRGHVEHGGKQLARDLVHVRDHQQQALGGGVCGGQGAGVQGAVHRAGGAGFGLHLLHLDGGAEDVLAALRSPLVNVVGHRARRGDGIDCGYFGESIGYMGGSVVAVHRLEVSLHVFYHLQTKNLLPGAHGRTGAMEQFKCIIFPGACKHVAGCFFEKAAVYSVFLREEKRPCAFFQSIL